jgi:hypothetical protein
MPYMVNAFHGGAGIATGVQTTYALTVVNPGADTNVANWTNDLGTIARRTATPSPHSGAGYFVGGTTAECRAHQDIAIPSANYAQVDAGTMLLQVIWWQAGFAGGDRDQAECEVEFFDGSPGSSLGARQSLGMAGCIDQVWQQREVHVTIPTATRTVRLYQHMLRTSGTNDDGYIDDISLALMTPAVVTVSLTVTNPGADTDVSSWTNDLGTIARRTATPSPHSGAGYFSGGTSAEVRAHQDVAFPGTESAPIDAGVRTLRLQWYQAGPTTADDDTAEMEYEFFDVTPSSLGARVGVGLLRYIGSWWLREVYVNIPATARSVRIYQHMKRPSGTNNDGYIDDITTAILVKAT